MEEEGEVAEEGRGEVNEEVQRSRALTSGHAENMKPMQEFETKHEDTREYYRN